MNNFGFTAVINGGLCQSEVIAYSSCISNEKINCYAHLMDKKRNRYVLFTDHIGSKFLYYTLQRNILGCLTMISNLYEWRHVNNWKCSFSELGTIIRIHVGELYHL